MQGTLAFRQSAAAPTTVMSGARAAFGERPCARGKFLFTGQTKYWVKGVTYGTFRPDADGHMFPGRARVNADFAGMAEAGINTVRVYTPPPRWLLDAAQVHGLRVMVGLPWEQHITFLKNYRTPRQIVARIRQWARDYAGHPALLCYAIGNEIPASIVRWHGRRRVERFLRRLFDAVKGVDPDALVTYVNFPTTEYLNLPFLDLVCFNVYLEDREELSAYLARVQNLAGEKPVILAELGLDSLRNGVDKQADTLARQLGTAFSSGCAGTFVFAWTDEWHRGGSDIEDWHFGLTDRDRQPKPALEAVRRAYRQVPFPRDAAWPRISVVVCTLNGSRTIRDTLEALADLEYPDFEVIVVNDGSTDTTADIVREYDVRLISTENRGLSAARNLGWQEASGEIVAYIDDDAYPDPHWLHYLAHAFAQADWVGVGGPNIAPPGDGLIADCVANAPGGPVHVLVSDTEAEHVPGCNMAFRRDALESVGGFDVRYRAAGDDVDLCWRLQELGGRIGFHPAAVDWHHRRNCLRMYWRQQKGYGKAEALLEEKWPERYNVAGHLTWGGRLYGRGVTPTIPLRRQRLYSGVWGSAGYQSVYDPAPAPLVTLPLMPEWYLVIAALGVLTLLGLSWPPLLWTGLIFALAATAPVAQAALAASRATFPVRASGVGTRLARWGLVFLMHLMQPLARLMGRIDNGLTPWRRRGVRPSTGQSKWLPSVPPLWSERWRPVEDWLTALKEALADGGRRVRTGGDWDDWDLEIQGGPLGSARLLLTVEEHGAGRQLFRVRTWPRLSTWGSASALSLAAAGVFAAMDESWAAAIVLGLPAIGMAARMLGDYLEAARVIALAATNAQARAEQS